MCSVGQMQIVTKHKTASCGTKLELDSDGRIVKKSPVARQTGTTVTIQNLFAKLPVRKIEFRRNIKKEYAKMCTIVQAYGIVSEGCRIICSNVNEKGVKSVVISTNGGNTMQENILNIFGTKQANDLVQIKSTDSADDSLNTTEIQEELTQLEEKGFNRLNINKIKLVGWVSSCEHGKGRSSKDRQFFYVNGRPCEPKSIQKLCNEVYHKYNINQNPFISLNVVIDRSDVDVNLTPDKRQVLINNESVLLLAIKIALIRTFEGMVGTYRIQNHISVLKPKEEDNSNELISEDEVVPKSNKLQLSKMLSQWKQTGDTTKPVNTHKALGGTKRKASTTTGIPELSQKMRKIQAALDSDNASQSQNSSATCLSDDGESESDDQTENPKDVSTISCSVTKADIIFEDKSAEEKKTVQELSTPIKDIIAKRANRNSSEYSRIDCPVDSPRAIKIIEDRPENRIPAQNVSKTSLKLKSTKIQVKITLEEVEEATKKEDELLEETTIIQSSLERLKFKSKIDPKSNNSAEEELKREITKESFRQMDIIGQFNLGFIIVRLEDDLFIIDQHASDEKYNFETLQRTTTLQNQKLVIPQPLDLTAPKEIILMDNLEVFKANGFNFLIDEDAPHTRKVKLTTKPFSQNWEFGKDDIDELLFMLQDAPSNTMCRPSRVRAMFASRACRKSVMIGSALSRSDMRRLVNHMSEIEHPWVSKRISVLYSTIENNSSIF